MINIGCVSELINEESWRKYAYLPGIEGDRAKKAVLLVIIFPCQTYLPHKPVILVRRHSAASGFKWTRVYLFLESRRGIVSPAPFHLSLPQ